MTEDIVYPKGFNWQCPQCGAFHSVADADLAGFVCTRCKGLGPARKPAAGFKAVVVPKIGQPPTEGPLRFRDTRFEVKLKDFAENKEETEEKEPEIAGRTSTTKGATRKRAKQ